MVEVVKVSTAVAAVASHTPHTLDGDNRRVVGAAAVSAAAAVVAVALAALAAALLAVAERAEVTNIREQFSTTNVQLFNVELVKLTKRGILTKPQMLKTNCLADFPTIRLFD